MKIAKTTRKTKTKTKPKKRSLSSNTIPGVAFARNFTKSPYSDDEKRIVNWLNKLSTDIGGGDDPIGFFMASYEYVIHERKELKRQIATLQMENERLTKIRSYDTLSGDDLAEQSFQIGNEYARRAEEERPSRQDVLETFARRGKAAQDAVDYIIKKKAKT